LSSFEVSSSFTFSFTGFVGLLSSDIGDIV
jgi:hypothetical protein